MLAVLCEAKYQGRSINELQNSKFSKVIWIWTLDLDADSGFVSHLPWWRYALPESWYYPVNSFISKHVIVDIVASSGADKG